MNYTLDTNTIIYLLDGKLDEALPDGSFYTSIISELELLSFAALTESKRHEIQRFLKVTQQINLTEAVCKKTIQLRCQHKLKLPDAIIAATAIVQESVLLSNDIRLGRITELSIQSLAFKV
ncbi:MAG: PIN domain-containing protein [Methylococcaceae bacterium]|nr:PIN domain-containing protein [Methylococcaceae bacterium]